MQKTEINIIVKAIDKATSQFKKISQSFLHLDKKMKSWGATLGWLNSKLDKLKLKLQWVKIWSKAFKNLQNEIKKTENKINSATKWLWKFSGFLDRNKERFQKMAWYWTIAFGTIWLWIKKAVW